MIRNEQDETGQDQADTGEDQDFSGFFHKIGIHDPDDTGWNRCHDQQQIHLPICIGQHFFAQKKIPDHEKQFRDHFADIFIKAYKNRNQSADMKQHIKKETRRLHAEYNLEDRQMS